jgi:hypothetical protein
MGRDRISRLISKFYRVPKSPFLDTEGAERPMLRVSSVRLTCISNNYRKLIASKLT